MRSTCAVRCRNSSLRPRRWPPRWRRRTERRRRPPRRCRAAPPGRGARPRPAGGRPRPPRRARGAPRGRGPPAATRCTRRRLRRGAGPPVCEAGTGLGGHGATMPAPGTPDDSAVGHRVAGRVDGRMDVHLVDGTYELFRYHFAPPTRTSTRGATIGVVGIVLAAACERGRHPRRRRHRPRHRVVPQRPVARLQVDRRACRRELLAQFPLVEDGARGGRLHRVADGRVRGRRRAWRRRGCVAAADDRGRAGRSSARPTRTSASASAARSCSSTGARTSRLDAAGVHERLGVPPDVDPRPTSPSSATRADGFPGLPGWGAKSAAAVLDRWGHLEDIPADPIDVGRRRARRGQAQRRRCASSSSWRCSSAASPRSRPTPRSSDTVDELRWTGPPDPTAFAELCAVLDAPRLAERATRLAAARG